MKFRRALLLVLCLIGFSAATLAQQQAASLTGSVMDSSGAAVPGASVSVSDSARAIRITTTSNERGEYTFPQLSPGENYVVSVSKTGFKETIQRGVVLQVAQSAKIDLTVDVGNVAETVTVSSDPPQLDTQTSSMGQVIAGQTVENLPLNGRSTFRL